MEADKNDLKILNELMDNSKAPLRKISDKVGLSFVTVMNRIKKLDREGIIKGYMAVLDYEKLGYDVEVLIEIRISKGKLFEVEKTIAAHPNVVSVYDFTGDFDALIMARFRSRKDMDTFLKKIQTYDFVERTNTRFILNTIKEGQMKV